MCKDIAAAAASTSSLVCKGVSSGIEPLTAGNSKRCWEVGLAQCAPHSPSSHTCMVETLLRPRHKNWLPKRILQTSSWRQTAHERGWNSSIHFIRGTVVGQEAFTQAEQLPCRCPRHSVGRRPRLSRGVGISARPWSRVLIQDLPRRRCHLATRRCAWEDRIHSPGSHLKQT